jgi:hypothetical protein
LFPISSATKRSTRRWRIEEAEYRTSHREKTQKYLYKEVTESASAILHPALR